MFKLIKNVYRPLEQPDWKYLFPLWLMKNKTPDPLDNLWLVGQTKESLSPTKTAQFEGARSIAESLVGYDGTDRIWVTDSHLQIVYYFDTLENCIAGMNQLRQYMRTTQIQLNWEIHFPSGEVKYYSY